MRKPNRRFPEYATIPIAFESWHVLDVRPDLSMVERKLVSPYHMDLDSTLGDAPTHWPRRFDLAHWGMFGGFLGGLRVGGAAVAYDSPDAIAHGRRELTVETQNTNAPACRFYARRGCRLAAANPGVYAEAPHEIQLLWFKDLVAPAPSA